MAGRDTLQGTSVGMLVPNMELGRRFRPVGVLLPNLETRRCKLGNSAAGTGPVGVLLPNMETMKERVG